MKFRLEHTGDGKNAYFPWDCSWSGIDLLQPPWSVIRKELSDVSRASEFDVFGKSAYRDGLAMWDVAIGVPSVRELKDSRAVTPRFVSNNEFSDITLPGLNRVGRVDGKPLRPCGEFCVDFVSIENGFELMELAHVMTHVQCSPDYSTGMYGRTADLFARNLVKVALSVKYGLGISLAGEICGGQLEVCSGKFRDPRIEIPCRPALNSPVLKLDKTTAVICGGVHIEPHPVGLNTGSSAWLEVNRWSCMPSSVSLAGWDTADGVVHSQIGVKGKNAYWIMPFSEMREMSEFSEYLEAVSVSNENTKTAYELLDSREYETARNITPPLPCRSCLRLNTRASGAPMRPSEEFSTDSDDWKVYISEMEHIYGIVQRAVMYHESRKLGSTRMKEERRKRSRNSSMLLKLEEKSSRLKSRAERLRRNGYVSESRKTRSELDEVEDNIRRLENGE